MYSIGVQIRKSIKSKFMSTTQIRKVSVLGGGAWGTALALHCARKGHDVLVWAREKSIVDAINIEHENSVFCKVRIS
jgi:glycerol-3-phosphate dehydrogenase